MHIYTSFLLFITIPFACKSHPHSWEINLRHKAFLPLYGDMILTPAQLARYQNANETFPIRGVSVKKNHMNRWVNNLVPIVISPQYTNEQKQTIKNSLKTFEQVSCFKFIDRSTETDYLFIVPLDGCYSYVGKIGGRQTVSLAAECVADYIIWHEMMHAIGFEHEHQRPDRDEYIRVEYANVIPGQILNFDKLQASDVDYPDKYDFKSIMHYDGSAFGIFDQNRRVRLATMVPLKPGIQLLDNLKFTQTDIRKLNRLGKCNELKNLKTKGFETCVDLIPTCNQSKREGMCENAAYRSLMRKNCRKTCNMCNIRSFDAKGEKCEDLRSMRNGRALGAVKRSCLDSLLRPSNLFLFCFSSMFVIYFLCII